MYARWPSLLRHAGLPVVAALLAGPAVQADGWRWPALTTARHCLQRPRPEGGTTTPDSGIAVDRLVAAQPTLLKAAVDALQPRVADQANVYAVAVAAGGSQLLFAREAKLALQTAAARFGAGYRGGVLLSNGRDDLLRMPLATRSNMLAAMRGIRDRIDPAHDIAFVYLASHGSPDAALATDLPGDAATLSPISAASVAAALARAGIQRRIIVVSACFSGSWIPALASDDTIVITAARRDRTSFGCDDTRRLTYFGQAFLEGSPASGTSLRDTFETARKLVSHWEAKERYTPSQPQVYVGKNMRAVWTTGQLPTN